MTKIDNLYIIYASAGLLQRSNIGFTEYKNQIFTNNWHINLRACDTAPLYHCPSPITGSNITKWYSILNCCSDFPRMNDPYV